MATAQEAVRRLTIVTSAPGADQAAASLRGVEKAMDGVTVASQKQEKATLSLDQKFASIERKYVAQVRAQQDYEKIQRQVNAAVSQNPALQERANVVLAAAKERHDQLTKSQQALGTVATGINSQMQAAASSFGTVGAALASIGPAGLAAAATLGVLSLGFKQAADAALALADTAGKLKDFSETTGFSVVQLQALQKAGAQVGVSAESVSRGLERFSVAMDDVKKGTGPVYESILEINPSLAQQLKQVNSLTDAWDIFAKAIKQADLEQSNKLARSVFGRSGVEITRLARANSDAGGLAGLTNQLKEIDRITAAQAERWDELGDKIAENSKAARQNIVSIFADPVLVATEKFSSGLLEASRAAKSFSMSDDLNRYLAVARSAAAAIPLVGPAVSAGLATAGAVSSRSAASPGSFPAADPLAGHSGLGAPGPSSIVTQLEQQKLALSQSIAEQERWNAALGAAVTPAENLRLGIDKLKLAHLENKISAEQSAKGQAALNAQYSSTQFSTYIGLLGQAASIDDQIQAKRNQINDAARQGVTLTKEQIAVQLELTRSQALGTFQIDAATDAEKVRTSAMLMSNEAAIAYTIVQTRINEARAKGAPLSAQEVADLQKSAEAYAKVKTQADAYSEALNGIASSMSSTLTTGLTDILDGTKSVGQGFEDMSKTIVRAIEEAIIKILIVQPLIQALKTGLSGFSLSGLFGVTGSAHGNIFDAGNVIPFARGGVVSQPTIFPMAHGMGLMGEAGPEAVLPLRRGQDGNLGVAAGGGGTPQITVNLIEDSSRAGEVQQSKGSNGGFNIEVFVDSITAKNIGNPGSATRQTLGQAGRLASR